MVEGIAYEINEERKNFRSLELGPNAVTLMPKLFLFSLQQR